MQKLRRFLSKTHLLPAVRFLRSLYFYHMADHPLQISWALTGLCNSKCIFCEAHEQLRGDKDIPTMRVFSLIDEMYDIGINSLLLVGGEAFMRKDIFDILEYIGSKGMRAQVITNALAIPNMAGNKIEAIKQNVSEISFSLDSTDAKQYDMIRGISGAFNRVLESIKLLADSKIKQNITAVIYPENMHQIPKLVGLASELGISSIHFQLISPGTIFENTKVKEGKLQLLPKNENEMSLLEGYIQEGIEISKEYSIETNLKILKLYARAYFESHMEDWNGMGFFMDLVVKDHKCLSVFTNNFIDYDGSFKLCPFLPPLGNVKEKSLRVLLSKSKKLKAQFKKGNIPLKFCKNCFCNADINLEFSVFFSPFQNRRLLRNLIM